MAPYGIVTNGLRSWVLAYKMVQWVKMLATKPDKLSWIPETNIVEGVN